MRWLAGQLAAAWGYFLLPFACFLLPARASGAVVNWASRRAFLYREETRAALRHAARSIPELEAQGFCRTFRQVRLIDAVDLWHGLFSSDRRIERSLVTEPVPWPRAERLVAVGTHVGPSTLTLRRLAAAGYRPRFVYRSIPVVLKRRAPVWFAYLRLRVAYLHRVCRGGAIAVPGGRGQVADAIAEPGCALVLLVDTAAGGERGGQVIELFGQALPVSPGGLALAWEGGATFSFFATRWDAETRRRVVEAGPARTFSELGELLQASAGFVQRTVEGNPAQWQLWSTEAPLLQAPDDPPA